MADNSSNHWAKVNSYDSLRVVDFHGEIPPRGDDENSILRYSKSRCMPRSWRPSGPVRTTTTTSPARPNRTPRGHGPLAVTEHLTPTKIPTLHFPPSSRSVPANPSSPVVPPGSLLLFCIGDVLHTVFRTSTERRNGREVYISCRSSSPQYRR